MIEETKRAPTLKEIYPDATDEELVAIDFVMQEHIRIVMDIYDRVCADPAEYAKFQAALTKRRENVK